MRRLSIIATAAACAVLGGCITYTYDVSMAPKAGAFERVTKVTRYGKTAPDENPQWPTDPKIRTTTTQVAGQTPADVGGAGSITQTVTTLGTLVLYIERFRGDPDPAQTLQNGWAAVDRFVDQVLGWLQNRLAGAPEAPAVLRFCDTDLRRDLKNILMLYFVSGQSDSNGRDSFASPAAFRCFQYLVERGYFSADELPRVMRALEEVFSPGLVPSPEHSEFLKRLLLVRAGVGPDGISLRLADFLGQPLLWWASFEEHLRTTPRYAELAAAAEQNGKPPPEPAAVYLPDDAAIPDLLRLVQDELKLQIASPFEPIATNGTWIAAQRVIRWSVRIGPEKDAHDYPFVTYAMWTEPDVAYQATRFRARVEGQRLAEYCIWRNGLSQTEGAAWDLMLESLSSDLSITAHAEKSLDPRQMPVAQAQRGIQLLVRTTN